MSKDLLPQKFQVQLKDRMEVNKHRPLVIWFTGYSGSGKSTIADALELKMYQNNVNTYILDGDNVRRGICSDLGFSDNDRKENIRRVGEIAALMADAGLVVITSFISPFIADREVAKKVIGNHNFIEVFINTSIETCEKRDPKGLYKKVRNGEIDSFTGITSPYEKPISPDMEINTEHLTVDEAADLIWQKISSKILLNGSK